MRPIVRTSRRKPEFPCRFRVTRTSASFSPGRGWRGESTDSLLTASAGSERCRCTPPAARGPGGRRCASDRVRKLCCSSLNKNPELWRAKRPGAHPLISEKLNQMFGDASGFFVLEPVAGVSEGIELCVGAVSAGAAGAKKRARAHPEMEG